MLLIIFNQGSQSAPKKGKGRGVAGARRFDYGVVEQVRRQRDLQRDLRLREAMDARREAMQEEYRQAVLALVVEKQMVDNNNFVIAEEL